MLTSVLSCALLLCGVAYHVYDDELLVFICMNHNTPNSGAFFVTETCLYGFAHPRLCLRPVEWAYLYSHGVIPSLELYGVHLRSQDHGSGCHRGSSSILRSSRISRYPPLRFQASRSVGHAVLPCYHSMWSPRTTPLGFFGTLADYV